MPVLAVMTRKLTRVPQAQVLEAFSATNGWQFETIQDLRSGLNSNKRGLQKLLKRIMQGDVDPLVLTHKDRLWRLGAELVHGVTTPSKRPYYQGHSPQTPLKKW
jgi:predicted site-specific integrase-resolvase